MVFAIFCIINMVFFAVALIAGSATTSAAMKVFRGTERNMGGDIQMAAGKHAAKRAAKNAGFGSEAPRSAFQGSDVPRYQV